ncbi:hypothetical protein NGRA_0754 [Nosema granulosis]|uniref:Uncharacterized protein n=1 Tax=Nosema granulosis TaxID=83296 RepID=A0A9P6L017_9MICR|nr:hypothetical protein NGRA_0754 [Nosema granulosis]
MMLFRKTLFKRLKDFKFSKDSYLLSDETIEEYEYVRRLYHKSIDILENFTEERDCLSCIKQLITFYEKSDTLVTSLVNEMLRNRFIDSIEKRLSLFEILNKLLRMFFLFDKHRHNSTEVFQSFAFLKVNHREELEERDVIKCSTFCSVAMPMGRLLISYFVTDGFEVFHPVILKMRTTLYLTETKKDYLLFINKIMVEHTDLKYVKLYFCALYEKLYDENFFDKFFESLKREEKAYYCDILNLS